MTRVAFATLGCRVNQADTDELQHDLEATGCRTVPFESPADVVVINTCTVTSRAELSDRQLIRRAARNHPNARIVVTGCWAQTDPSAVAALPGVDLVVGTGDRHRIAEWVRTVAPLPVRDADGHATLVPEESPELLGRSDQRALASAGTAEGNPFPSVRDQGMGREGGASRSGRPRTRVFVKIQDGCQHRCAFCIVPFARGASRSRDPRLIMERVTGLVESGHREVVLTGVDLGHYGADLVPRTTLARLLGRLADVPGLRWLRLSSILPAYFTPELTEAIAAIRVLAPHLHVPLQSGSDRVLKSMRRPYSTMIYTKVIERVVEAVPGLGLGTDLIAGFPGEDEADFLATCDLVAALPFSYFHVFPYSARRGTEAFHRLGRPAPRLVAARARRLRALGADKNLAFRRRMLGTLQDVLVLTGGDRASGRLVGLTGNYVEVAFAGPEDLRGRLAQVRITDVHGDRTEGELHG